MSYNVQNCYLYHLLSETLRQYYIVLTHKTALLPLAE